MITRIADVNLALNKPVRQISTLRVYPASNAVDGHWATASCTLDNAGQPWWSVDLGQHYYIGRVTITFPWLAIAGSRNYHRFCFVH